MFLIIDGGTTNLRVTLLSDERKPLDAIARDGGVRHTAVDGNNGRLKAALAECIDQLLARNGLDAGDVKRCVAYGMITSDMGLLEIPHVPAPGFDRAPGFDSPDRRTAAWPAAERAA